MENFEVANPQQYRFWHILIVSLGIVFPLCMLKAVNRLRYAAMITIAAIVFTAVLLIVELPFYWERPDLQGKFDWVKFDWGFLNAFGITFWAFTCQTSFFSSMEGLEKCDTAHKYKVSCNFLIFRLQFVL